MGDSAPANSGPGSGRKITAVLFDMDGLLLDTEGAYTIAQQRVLDRFGKVFTWEHKAAMMGRAAVPAATVLLEALGLGPDQITPQQFLTERDALLEAVFPDTPLMPGAERLVRHLAAHGVPIAVATGSHMQAFELKTGKHSELFSLFKTVVTGDMVARAKPDPAIFLQAAAALEPRPTDMSTVLVLEDAPNGVEAAGAAGMPVVLVPYPGFPPHLLPAEGSCSLLGSLEEFVPEQWGLPPYPAEAAA